MANSDGFNLFGFQIKRAKTKENWSVVPPVSDDGSVVGSSNAAYYGLVIDLEGIVKNENDLIRRYREISNYGDCDSAVEDIVNEAIVADSNKVAISIQLDELQLPDKIKDIITAEFDNVLRLLDFEEKCHDIFRQWYIDGRLFYNVILDPQNPKNGIVELRYVDPRKIRKIKNVKKDRDPKTGADIITSVEEYYLFNDKGITEQTSQGIKISTDSIIYCHSGLIDYNTGMALSYLHKAIKPCNQLKVMEDATVIYRISRAPERRVFYIDVGNLPKLKAEQFVQEQMNKYRNKIVFDASTGEVRDNRQHLSLMEDFWMPRRGDGKSTEITTLTGACLAMDTKVSLLDGRELSIQEIAQEINDGKTLWTYSCDEYTGEIKPGLISWAGVTQEQAAVMKLTLDNGETIVCTPDHKFPLYERGFVEAKDLTVGESLIPLYRKREPLAKTSKLDYEMVFDNATKKWKFTHRMIKANIDLPFEIYEQNFNDHTVVHHKNANRFNNSPDNLCLMSFKDHGLYHRSIKFEPMVGARALAKKIIEEREKNSEWYQQKCKNSSVNSKKYWNSLSEDDHAKICQSISAGIRNYIDSMTDEEREIREEKSRKNVAKASQKHVTLMQTDPEFNQRRRDALKKYWENEELQKLASERTREKNLRMWREEGDEAEQYRVQRRLNHIEQQKVKFDHHILAFIIDTVKGKTTHQVTVFDVVDALNNDAECLQRLEDLNRHKSVPNWSIDDGFTVTLIKKCVQQFGYASWKDFRVKESLHNHRIVKIEYLDEQIPVGTLTIDANEMIHNHHTFALSSGVFTKNSNLGQVEDINYFQMKLYQSLNVPISRLQPQQGFSLGRTTEVTREEVKFNKFIERLRRKFSSLFRDTLRVQLITKGIIRPEEWDAIAPFIRFDYQRDNHFAELKTSEILMQRMQVLQLVDSYVGKYFSMQWIKENVLMQTEEDMKLINAQMQAEQPMILQQTAALQQAQQGEAPE